MSTKFAESSAIALFVIFIGPIIVGAICIVWALINGWIGL